LNAPIEIFLFFFYAIGEVLPLGLDASIEILLDSGFLRMTDLAAYGDCHQQKEFQGG
jgi:hypothetical protein